MRTKVLIARDGSVEETRNLHSCHTTPDGDQQLPLVNGQCLVLVINTPAPGFDFAEFCHAFRSKVPDYRVVLVMDDHLNNETCRFPENGMFVINRMPPTINELVDLVKLTLEGPALHVREAAVKPETRAYKGIKPYLTKREHEVLSLIADGYTNPEIAGKLFISCSTVDSHRKNLLLKFNVHNTARLIKTAVSMGMLH